MAVKKNAIETASEEQIGDILMRFAAGENMSGTEGQILRQVRAMYPNVFAAAAVRRTSRASVGRRVAGSVANAGASQGTSLSGLNQNLQAHNYGTQKVTSPGGFKKSGQDIDSDIRRAGHRTPEAIASRMVKIDDRTGQVLVRNGHGGVTLNRDQVQYILNRGSRGGTMTPDMQMVYDAFVQRDERRNAAEIARRTKEEQDAAADRAAAQKQAEEEYKAKVALQKLQEQNRLAIAKDRAAYDRKAPERAETARKNRESELAAKLKAGTHAYTREQERQMNQLLDDIDSFRDDPGIDEESKQRAINAAQGLFDKIRFSPRISLKPQVSIEDQFKEGTYTDTDGKVWTRTKDGFRVAYDPKTSQSEAKKSASDEKSSAALEKEKRAYEQRQLNFYRNAKKEETGESGLDEIKVPMYTEEQALKLARLDAERYYPTPAPPPSPTTPPTVQRDEPSPSDDIESEADYQLNPSTAPAQPAPQPSAADFAKNNDVLGYLKAKKAGAIAQPAQPAATQPTAAQPAAVQQPPLAQATEAQPPEPEQPVQQQQDNVQDDQQCLYGKCPKCGAALTPDGTCPTCGWPNSQQTQTVQPATETPAQASDAAAPLQS